MEDPRDKRFAELQKRDVSQLRPREIREYLAYCEAMIKYVGYKKSRRGWIKKKNELNQLLDKRE